jgi:hypothetical protein
MEVSGQLRVPATLPPVKETRYPLDRRLGGAPEQVRTLEKCATLKVFFLTVHKNLKLVFGLIMITDEPLDGGYVKFGMPIDHKCAHKFCMKCCSYINTITATERNFEVCQTT